MRLVLIILFLGTSLFAWGQDGFLTHLYCNELNKDLDTYFQVNQNLSESERIIAILHHYRIGDHEQLEQHFGRLAPENKRTYAAAYNFVMAIDRDSLAVFQASDEKQLYVAGRSLLVRDFKLFDSLLINHPEHVEGLGPYRDALSKVKKKSMFLGGLYSALLPGMGKVYAGKPKSGLLTMLVVAMLGAQTYESFYHDGPKHGRFISYASLFSIFYIGNIWGSALSVKIEREENLYDIDHQIQLDLRIPVDRLLDICK